MGFFKNVLGTLGKVIGKVLPDKWGNAISGEVDYYRALGQHKDDLNWQANQAELNRQFQRNERLEAQEYDLFMWNANNLYNSPEAQVQRLKDAGINPNSMMGESQYTPSPPTTTPMSGNVASASSPLAPHLLKLSAEIDNIRASTDNTNADTKDKRYELSWKELTQEERYKALVKSNELLDTQIYGIKVDKEIQQKQFMWYSKLSEAELQQMEAATNKLRNDNIFVIQQILTEQERTKLTKQQTATEKERTALTEQQTATEKERTELTNRQIQTEIETAQLLDSQGVATLTNEEKAKVETDILRIQQEFSTITGIPLGTPEFQLDWSLFLQGELWNYYNRAAMKGIEGFTKSLGESAGGRVPSFRGSMPTSNGRTHFNPTRIPPR